jgi:hypothetical protein
MWYVVQICVFIAVIWFLQDYLGLPRQTPLWIVGAAAALWVTVVINSISRARELRATGRGWLWKWAKEVWAAEDMLPDRRVGRPQVPAYRNNAWTGSAGKLWPHL